VSGNAHNVFCGAGYSNDLQVLEFSLDLSSTKPLVLAVLADMFLVTSNQPSLRHTE
jgi:hypothetical protein